jgi:hypothetical protein
MRESENKRRSLERLNTILGKIESLQNFTYDNHFRWRLDEAKNILLKELSRLDPY